MAVHLSRAFRLHDHAAIRDSPPGTPIVLHAPVAVQEVESVPSGPGAVRKREFFDGSLEEFRAKAERRGFSCTVEPEGLRSGSETLLPHGSLGAARGQLLRYFTAFKRALGPWSATVPEEPVVAPLDEAPHGKVDDGFVWRGGEAAALAHWQDYLWSQRGLETYKTTRNGLLRSADSAKISPWLATGCLSARWVMHGVRRYEARYGASESTAAFIDEILWRDYFKHLARVAGARFYSLEGISDEPRSWSRDIGAFRAWALGRTGEPFVDAGMRELWWTGWMSNRLRQNVASYLAKTLRIDWTWGARWFEAHLIDEDPECNWGNWQYVSGVGTDPRDRLFDVKRQAEFYDPHGEYQRIWAARPTRPRGTSRGSSGPN